MRKSKHYYLRKTHRWISVFIGVQILLWTASGIYFSWTDIDEIHGDQFLSGTSQSTRLSQLAIRDWDLQVAELEVRFIDERPYLWVNKSTLIDPESGEEKPGVSKEEAKRIARRHIKGAYDVTGVSRLTEVGPHHEYRGRPLPVWAVSFEGPQELTAYVSERDGSFQIVRHQSWRIFDFLWMLHTMDYESRDDFNNFILRVFSLFALVVVLSGLALFYFSRRRRTELV